MEAQELLASANEKLEAIYSIHDYFFSDNKREKQVFLVEDVLFQFLRFVFFPSPSP